MILQHTSRSRLVDERFLAAVKSVDFLVSKNRLHDLVVAPSEDLWLITKPFNNDQEDVST